MYWQDQTQTLLSGANFWCWTQFLLSLKMNFNARTPFQIEYWSPFNTPSIFHNQVYCL